MRTGSRRSGSTTQPMKCCAGAIRGCRLSTISKRTTRPERRRWSETRIDWGAQVIAPGKSARELLVSLVSEERRGRPGAAANAAIQAAGEGPAGEATQLIVAVYAALAAGEPR